MGSLIIGQFPQLPAEGETLRWYAMRAFYNRTKPFAQALKKAGIDVFVPPMPSLFFIRATVRYIRELKRIYYDSLMFYAEPGTSDPAAVKDKEMEMFRLVCSTPLEYLKFFDERHLQGGRGLYQAHQEGPPPARQDRGRRGGGHGIHPSGLSGTGGLTEMSRKMIKFAKLN